MSRRLRFEEVQGRHLEPVASVMVPVSQFRELGVEFDHDIDDLDAYELAAFASDQEGVFALMHYLNSPDQTMTLLVDDAGELRRSLSSLASYVAHEFHFPVEAVQWRLPDAGTGEKPPG